MKGKNIKSIKDDMQKTIRKMPKSINEAIDYDEYQDMENHETEIPSKTQDNIQPSQEQGFDVDEFIDNIRKQSLKGMAQLADDPLSEQYQILKKVWQIVDKAAEMKGQDKDTQRDNMYK